MIYPNIGETWRWSYCDGPDWCCGNIGVVTAIYSNGSIRVKTNDATGYDEFNPNDPELRRVELAITKTGRIKQ